MVRILVYEPLSAGDAETTAALQRGSPAHREMLAAGRAMRDAIAADLAALPGIDPTVAMDEQEAGQAQRGRPTRTVAPLPGEGAVAFVARHAPGYDHCWIVAPESAGLLLRLHDAVGEARWIGCSRTAIRVAASKQATSAALARAGILTPGAFAPFHAGAWVVKPDDGAGSLDARRHATRAAAEADLRARDRAGRQAVMEPWVGGEPLSLSLIVGPVLAEAVAFNRQQLHIDAAGRLHDRGVQPAALSLHDPRAKALHALARKVAAALPGLRGYVGIDLVWNEGGRPVVIEVNPRVTCAYVGLSAILRRNLAADILEAARHVPA